MVAPVPAPEDIMLPPSPPELAEAPLSSPIDFKLQEMKMRRRRPDFVRRSTEPISDTISDTFSNLQIRPRNRSPYSRSHFRSRSSASILSAPPMTRAHSSPSVDSAGRYVVSGRPSSPLNQSGRRRSPLRSTMEDSYPSWSRLNIDHTISEHAELDTAALSTLTDFDTIPVSPTPSASYTFPRTRRRPSSPLHQLTTTTTPSPLSANTSPVMAAQKFNEPYPSTNYSFGSASSVPSTPTSMRSRSPSISSLETIPDSPGAEEAALEAERIAQLKAAAEAEEKNNEADGRRTRGFGFGGRGDKRKRWSVCGAERRGDLDLETIWED